MSDPKSILITGASSGIGEALALEYAGPDMHLALTGRDRERLHEVAARCRDCGATVSLGLISVTNKRELGTWIRAVDESRPLDLVVANAGISGIGKIGFDAHVRRIFEVNVTGTFNTVHPVLERMRGRGHGHIAIMSSLAALRPGLGEAGYGASKAALKFYGEALRYPLMNDNIRISVICPGYVQTPMTAHNDYSMPFLITAKKAASAIRRGIARNRPLIAFPWPAYLIARLATHLPEVLAQRIFRPSQKVATVPPFPPGDGAQQA